MYILYQNVQIVGVIIRQLYSGTQQSKKLKQQYGKTKEKKLKIEKKRKAQLKEIEKLQLKLIKRENPRLNWLKWS